MGAAPDPTTKYTIGNGRLEISKAFGGASGIDLPPTSHEVKQSLVQKGLDLGDVIVRGNGPELTCQRVTGVKAFITALYDVGVTDAQASQAPWHSQLGVQDCGSRVVVVPGLPQSFSVLAHRMQLFPKGENTYGVVGKWAQSGDRIFKIADDAIKAPVQGQFLGSPFSFDPETRGDFFARQRLKLRFDGGSDAACFFLPMRGLDTDFYARNFHDWPEIIDNVGWIVHGHKPPRRAKYSENEIQQLKADWVKFSSEPLKVIPLREMPALHPDYKIPPGVDVVMPEGFG